MCICTMVRIAEPDEMSYRRQLWTNTPLTDFWRVGKVYAKKLQAHGLKTMGDIAIALLASRKIFTTRNCSINFSE